MRYLIVGAGAVGGTIGGRLYQHGHRVTLVARGAHLTALRDHGLLLATPDGEHRLEVPTLARPDHPFGLTGSLGQAQAPGQPGGNPVLEPDTVLVLTVKSQHSQAALEAWADVPVRGGGVAADRLPVLCAQNGVANERTALRLFQRVYGVCVWLPATHLSPGVVSAEGQPRTGMLHIGRYPVGTDETAARVADDLSASGFETRVRADVMRWKYGKLLANLGNGLDALLESRDQELAGQVRAEGVAVLDAAGIAYTSRQEESAERGDRVRIAPVAGRPRGGSSTWQSLARGTGSVEVDYLNGEVVLLGREHGVPTPVNAAVQRAARQAARAGVPPGRLRPDQLFLG